MHLKNRSKIYNFLVTTLYAGAFILCSSGGVKAAILHPSDDWVVSQKSSYSDSDNVKSDYCMAKVTYGQDHHFILARDYSGAASFALHVPDTLSDVLSQTAASLKIDNIVSRQITPKLSGDHTLVFSLLYDFDFLDALKGGETLTVNYGAREYNFSLKGSSNGLKQVDNCLQQASGNKAILDRGPVNAGLLPMPGSFSNSVLPKYSNARPHNIFQDPDRTYIKVHFPGAPMRAAPVAAVEQHNLSVKAGDVCHADDVQTSWLSKQVNQYLIPQIKLASDSNDLDATQPVSWEQNEVKSHFIMTDLPEQDIRPAVLQDMKQTCAGDFALKDLGRYDWQGVVVRNYNAACFEKDRQVFIDLNFISDGFETAILSLESSAEHIEQSTQQRNLLLNNL